jgi:hypothetical protein
VITSEGLSNSCFSTFDRKLSPSSSLCSFFESSALGGFITLLSVCVTFFTSGCAIGELPVFTLRLVTRVFCSISFFLCSSSAFLLASPACLFFSISSKLIVAEVLWVLIGDVLEESLEIVFLVMETMP